MTMKAAVLPDHSIAGCLQGHPIPAETKSQCAVNAQQVKIN